jgi:lycopene cyclase domain-containing protein
MALTYFGSLALFTALPLLVLGMIVPHDLWHWLFWRQGKVEWRAYIVLLAHVVLALVYTTPWDNYLVATGVWWYQPERVVGFRIGYVPIEEYTFFILQPLMTGLWTLAVMHYRIPLASSIKPHPLLRFFSSLAILLVFIISFALWRFGWKPGTYLSLILSWASLPMLIQFAFGADILWANHRSLILVILPMVLYLWIIDAVSIGAGIWSIDPAQTLGLYIHTLPIEEMVFFLLTNVIISFGMTLMLAPQSHGRLSETFRQFKITSSSQNITKV